MVIDWYVTHDYDFLALSDHNVLQAKEVWMSAAAIEKRRKALGKPTVEKYRGRFGAGWVTMREVEGVTEVRLKKMSEYAPLFEKPGKFLLVPAEEISASFGKVPLHMNAINLQQELKPLKADSIPEVLRANLRAVAAQEQSTGQPIMVHLNHPNFQWAITAEDIAEVVEDQFFEVYNGHKMTYCNGDEHRVGTEMLWDIANTIRLGKLKAAPLMGVATDDSHHYHGEEQSPGRGWVMVRAGKLESASLVNAMRKGDFYASSGVTLEEVKIDGATLRVVIKGEPGVTYTTRFNGTPRDYDATTTEAKMPMSDPHPTRLNYSADVGKVFATAEGTEAAYKLTGGELFVRATITSSKAHGNPSFENQVQMAWTQPCVPAGR